MLEKTRSILVSGLFVSAVTLAFCIMPDSADAQRSEFVDLIGQYNTPGDAIGVVVQGGYAYVAAANPDSLFIIDVSDPSNPVQVGSFFSAQIRALHVVDTVAYLGAGDLVIVNVSDPSNPTLLGSVPTNQILAVYTSGNIAFTGEVTVVLSTWDVSDPTAPVFLTRIPLVDVRYFARDIQVHGSLAYVANDAGLKIIDVSNPSSLAIIGTYNTTGQARGVSFVPGAHAFVADGDSGLRIIDVSEPETPSEVGFYDGPGVYRDVATDEDFLFGEKFAYVANDFLGMRVIYAGNLSNPIEIAYYDTDDQAWDIFAANGLIYLADGSDGLLIFRKRIVVAALPDEFFTSTIIHLTVSDLTGLGLTAIQFVLTYDSSLIDTGSIVFFDSTSVLWETNWTVEYNADTPGSLAVALIGTDELAGSDTLLGMILKSADGAPRGAQANVEFSEFIFNEGDPLGIAEPAVVILGFPFGDISGNGRIMAFDASLAFQHSLGIIVLDEQQQIKADVSGNGTIDEFDASLILQFVVRLITEFPVEQAVPAQFPAEGIISIPDVTASPGEIITFPVELSDGTGIFAGSFTIDYDHEALIFRGIEKSSLTENYMVGNLENEGQVRLLFAGSDVIEGDGTIAEVKFEVADDARDETMILLTKVKLNGDSFPLTSDTAFVRLLVTDVSHRSSSLPYRFSLEQNYPNPFNPSTGIDFALPVDADVKVAIYDLMVRKVSTLTSRRMDAGFHNVVWRGTNDAGDRVGSGIYLYRLEAIGEKQSFEEVRKMVLLR